MYDLDFGGFKDYWMVSDFTYYDFTIIAALLPVCFRFLPLIANNVIFNISY